MPPPVSERKILYGLIAITILVAVFLASYLFSQPGQLSFSNLWSSFLRADLSSSKDASSDSTASKNDSDEIKVFSPVSRRVVSLANSPRGEAVLYYEKGSGKTYELNLKNFSERVISDKILPNFLNSIWSPKGTEVVSKFYEPSGDTYKYFSFKNQSAFYLPKGVRALGFSPSGNETAYFVRESADEYGQVFLSTPDGKSAKSLLRTRLNIISIVWIDAENIVLKSKNSSDQTVSLVGLDKNGGLTEILDNTTEANLKVSPDGNRILMSFSNNSGDGSIVRGSSGGDTTKVSSNLKADNCAWTLNSLDLICIVYEEGASSGQIKRINPSSKEEVGLATLKFRVSPSEVILSDLEDNLIFIDSISNKLYVVRI
jgi:hypothetical protein